MTVTAGEPDLSPRAAPGPTAGARRRLRLIAFMVGSASLGAEIAAARLLAPYFGASTVIWANTIATVLVALSAGYALGGRLADRRPDIRGLCSVVLLAGVLLALVPLAADPFLRLSVGALGSLSVGGFLGSLLAVLVLVAVPVALLGTVAPYANRLAVGDLGHTGTVTGGLYAISTAGSLVGTFLAALVLIPLIGTHRTFVAFALALVMVAAPGMARRRYLAVPVAVAALLALPVPSIGAGVASARVILSTETPYQHVRVLQFPDGERWLQLDEGVAIHSDLRPGSYLTGGYWDDFLVLPVLTGSAPPRRVAILGNAAGTVARALGHFWPAARVDAVELDGELTRIGRRLFDLRGPGLHTYTADARPWLAHSRARYDDIFIDAYRQPYIPFYLLTRQFFDSVRQHLRRGGLAIVNVGHVPGSDALEKVVTATLGSVLAPVLRDPVSTTNSLVIAARGRSVGGSGALPSLGKLPAELRTVARAAAPRLAPGLRGGPVYTDDRAPVEWLTDLSILRYATAPPSRAASP